MYLFHSDELCISDIRPLYYACVDYNGISDAKVTRFRSPLVFVTKLDPVEYMIEEII